MSVEDTVALIRARAKIWDGCWCCSNGAKAVVCICVWMQAEGVRKARGRSWPRIDKTECH